MAKKLIEVLSVTRSIMFTAVVTALCADVIVKIAKEHNIKCPIKVEIKK